MQPSYPFCSTHRRITLCLLALSTACLRGEDLPIVEDQHLFAKAYDGKGNVVLQMTAFLTAGGSVPKDYFDQVRDCKTCPTGYMPDINGTQIPKADLLSVQHAYAANFDIDLAPKIPSDREQIYERDDFDQTLVTEPNGNQHPDTWIGNGFRLENLPWNKTGGLRVEDYDYSVEAGRWLLQDPGAPAGGYDLATLLGFDVGSQYKTPPDSAPMLQDAERNSSELKSRPAPPDAVVDFLRRYERIMVTCNVGPQFLTGGLPDPNNVAVVGETLGSPTIQQTIASNGGDIRMITGPLAAFWAAPTTDCLGLWRARLGPNVPFDPDGDYDHDGATNAQECEAGTDPTDPKSVLRLVVAGAIEPSEDPDTHLPIAWHVPLSWLGVSGKVYQLERTTDLKNWDPVGDVFRASATATINAAFDNPDTINPAFYRVRLQ
ncbi:MAG: hypothetical protein HYR88_17260 [Verrucomicrobia bacterium]|nr:hypothetical protein [Verrucomicrobiota bacterium]MBI3869348.1 hypothetical protein [Verrucomicrobiota bacterium]